MGGEDYPQRFDVNDSRLSSLVLGSAIAVDQYKIRGNIDSEYEQAIETLSKMFFELSKTEADAVSMGHLIDFYWPEGNLEGKTIGDLKSRSRDFAEDLAAFRYLSKAKQTDLVNLCCELHKNLLPIRHSRRRLAA